MKQNFWALYSGGKDSMTAAHVLHERGELAGVVSFLTGIATPNWLPFIEKVVNEMGWNWETYKTPANFEKLVLEYGFPGPPMHGLFMNRLKGRCVRQFKKHHKGEWLASGIRQQESARRMVGTKKISQFEGVNVNAVIYDWDTPTVWRYFNDHGFARSPAYQTLCISGDCLCGAYATPMERAAIKAFYPEVWSRIESLEKKVDTKWGMGGKRFDKNQLEMSFLCADCEAPE